MPVGAGYSRGDRMARMLILASVLLAFLAGAAAADEEAGWRPADGYRQWLFPRDRGAHPEYRTEWWYFTGNLADDAGDEYGYQLTFFRQGLRLRAAFPENPWSLRDVYLAHLAVTGAREGLLRFAERVARPGPGLAGAATTGLDVHLLGWSAREEEGVFILRAASDEVSLDLELRPRKPVVLHGSNGLSRKGPAAGQASWYASITDLETRGTVTTPAGTVRVSGTSWFDQEFGSNQLAPGQAGWDWFSIHLADGRDLMLYLLRRTDGTVEPASSGTLVESDGAGRHLSLDSFRVTVRGHWTSPRSGGRYPARWLVSVPGAGVEVTLEPLVADSELDTGSSTGVTYWEGAVKGSGLSAGVKVDCRGYVELTGYAGSLGGVF